MTLLTVLLAVPSVPALIAMVVVIAFIVAVIFNTFFTVEQQTVAVIQRLGKFHKLADPGLNIKVPFIDSVVDRVNMRVQQLDVKVETKTKDNVFVHVTASVQYKVLVAQVKDAYYKLNDPQVQINSYVFDVIRSKVPSMELDEVFLEKDAIAKEVTASLTETMKEYGYEVVKSPITDIEPDKKVKESMNRINAALRDKDAAENEGEAKKILIVKDAEAKSESKELQGKGIAKMRKAIVSGFKEAAEDLQKIMPNASAEDVMKLILTTQYFDMMKEIGGNSRSNVVFLNSSPGGFGDIMADITKGMITANKLNDPIDENEKRNTEEHSS